MTETAVARFRKKPVEIDAMQWDGTAKAAGPVIDWILANGGTARYHEADLDFEPKVPPCLKIDTLEGTMTASPNDWIIRGVKGEFYSCKPDVFDTTYERVATPEPFTVHFSGGPWDGQTAQVKTVVAPVFAVGHAVGTHYWLDTKSDPPTYFWQVTRA